MSFSERLKAIRKDKGMSQSDLAKKLTVSIANISQYERGLRDPKRTQIVKFAEALGVQPIEFFDPAIFSAPASQIDSTNKIKQTISDTEDIADGLSFYFDKIFRLLGYSIKADGVDDPPYIVHDKKNYPTDWQAIWSIEEQISTYMRFCLDDLIQKNKEPIQEDEP